MSLTCASVAISAQADQKLLGWSRSPHLASGHMPLILVLLLFLSSTLGNSLRVLQFKEKIDMISQLLEIGEHESPFLRQQAMASFMWIRGDSSDEEEKEKLEVRNTFLRKQHLQDEQDASFRLALEEALNNTKPAEISVRQVVKDIDDELDSAYCDTQTDDDGDVCYSDPYMLVEPEKCERREVAFASVLAKLDGHVEDECQTLIDPPSPYVCEETVLEESLPLDVEKEPEQAQPVAPESLPLASDHDDDDDESSEAQSPAEMTDTSLMEHAMRDLGKATELIPREDDVVYVGPLLSIHQFCWELIANPKFAPLLYKVGITSMPFQRWNAYFYDGYYMMFVIFESSDPEEVENLERFLISYLQSKEERCQHPQKPRIQNQIPGGEGSMRRYDGPYFTYICIASGLHCGKLRAKRTKALQERLARKRKAEAEQQQ